MTIGERIRAARKKAGLTQSELAVKANVRQGQLSNYENCLIIPTIRVLVRIADALDVSLESMTTTKGA